MDSISNVEANLNEAQRIYCPAYINISSIIDDIQTFLSNISICLSTTPNLSSTEFLYHQKICKRNYDHISSLYRAIRSSSLDSRNTSHRILLVSESSARTVTSRTFPRSSPLFLTHKPSLLPDNSKHSPFTDLHPDLPATRLLRNKLLVHQSIRLAHFLLFPLEVFVLYLLSLLASLGQLAPRNPLHAAAPSPLRFSSVPKEDEPMLECAQCDAVVPLSDLTRHKPRPATSYTAELLSQVLAPQHLEQYSDRKGEELLLDDDTQLAVPNVSEFQLLPSKTIDSLNGMSVLLNFTDGSKLCELLGSWYPTGGMADRLSAG